jgi:hypothetical protein
LREDRGRVGAERPDGAHVRHHDIAAIAARTADATDIVLQRATVEGCVAGEARGTAAAADRLRNDADRVVTLDVDRAVVGYDDLLAVAASAASGLILRLGVST